MGVPPVDSPVLTGNPQAPTPALGDADTSIATTAFVSNALSGVGATFPPGTLMIFHQTNAPVGWTKETTHNDKALRVVTGGVGAAGVLPFTTAFGRLNTDQHTLSTFEMPVHAHAVFDPSHAHSVADPTHTHSSTAPLIGSTTTGSWDNSNGIEGVLAGINPAFTGIGIFGAFTGISLGNNGSGGSHSHGADMRVQYVDVIIAHKN